MLRREAAGWLARLQSEREPDIEARFRRWRDSDPRNARAFERVSRSYEQAGLLRTSLDVGSRRPAAAIRKPGWRARPALAAAAAIVLLVPVGLLLVRSGSLERVSANQLTLITNVGEIRQVKLADGSILTLDTSTRLDLRIGPSGRSARLDYGRIRLRIAPASQPFVVETSSSAISASGGVIDVEQIGARGRMLVLAGSADVRGSSREEAPKVTLEAGEGATLDPSGPEREVAATLPSDWTRGMLQFDAAPLPDAVALANRYSQRKIILEGDFSSLRVTGAFRAGDTAGLARALAEAFALSLKDRPDGSFELSPGASFAPRKKNGG